MKNSKIKLGIFNWFGYIMPPTERVNKIIEAGFDSIMLWWDEELFSKEGKKDLLKILEMDISIENIHAPYYECNKIWSNNEVERNYIINEFIKCIHDCYTYNIPVIVMHLTQGDYPHKPNINGLNSIKTILDEARRYGIRIAIENTRQEEFFEYILKNIKSDWLGVCYDSSHANLYSTSICEVLNKYGNRLMALHLSDNDGCTDRHWLPYEGVIDWNEIIIKLEEIEYTGNLSFEVFYDKTKNQYDPEKFLKMVHDKAVILRTELEYIL
ncbi:sugar phosphate isomerase/epimerase [Vallitalea sediminicola]